ncbi:Rne/Rng family ribonuclease [Candidatus Nitronereus thalassa]|uniref:Ribonuclease G n=1 Tax=Candidatus Nitronereus thalassa TaxID=3020898 RepID=A0ABU3K839_9BACT|nr:Rne/Rng family ribonuclease [Candidatus Nitronereus thalassa]MDT7042610.1 Rne/Rng family ribonuclease [Candidatus Nitronereus thalassa]
MGVEIAFNVTPQETRVAVLENKVVTELYVDRAKKKDFVGDVYKGKVVKVLPGMQAAFIDIGLDRAAFVHVSDLSIGTEPGDILVDNDGDDKGQEVPRPRRQHLLPIEDLLSEGQELMVQISKGPIGTKGPRVTSYCSLPGRFLVLMPNVNDIGISRRIADDEERRRLKDIMKRVREPGYGYIVRTVSENVSEEDLRSDVDYLTALWQDILKKHEQYPAPAMLHTDLSLTLRVVRDLFTKKVDRLLIDSREECEAVRDFVKRYLPEQSSRIYHYDKEEGLFEHLGVEMEISRALSRKVWLKSGGHLVIDHTEAMTVVDVNTGRFVGKRDQEETILKTNMEAAREVAYQIKLRGIGGIIIVDFIDMERERNRDKVYHAMVDAMANDKARTRISRITDLGLIEISRERVREDILRTLSDLCTDCDGRGYTKSATTVIYDIFRDIRRIGRGPSLQKVMVGANPIIVDMLRDTENEGLEQLERECNHRIVVQSDPLLHLEHYDIVVIGEGSR